jgi:hypothetical protein
MSSLQLIELSIVRQTSTMTCPICICRSWQAREALLTEEARGLCEYVNVVAAGSYSASLDMIDTEEPYERGGNAGCATRSIHKGQIARGRSDNRNVLNEACFPLLSYRGKQRPLYTYLMYHLTIAGSSYMFYGSSQC